jgi:hypothetical protein
MNVVLALLSCIIVAIVYHPIMNHPIVIIAIAHYHYRYRSSSLSLIIAIAHYCAHTYAINLLTNHQLSITNHQL